VDVLDLSRWQFGITTVYHFFFVPITLGLVWFVAAFQTIWYFNGQEKYLKLTKFFGKLFLINFALGVVTGIVQEFQFGMNWADYSRFVGDVFGAPLAMEGLLAFFLESTFLGLWIFGWDRLPKKVHLATIWAAAFGTMLSAYFILAANAWMQHPVGFEIDPTTGRAVLNDIGAVLFQNTAVIAFFHTMSASFLVAGTGVAAVGAWFLIKNRQIDIFRPAIKAGAVVTLIAAVAVSITGDLDSKIMVEQQPMKMAAAEALYETTENAPFSVLTIGDVSGENATPILEVPGLLSFLSTGSFDGTVEGINDLQARYESEFGPGNYVPNVPITYWGFRLMIGLGMLGAAWSLWALWRYRGGRNPQKGRIFGFSTLFVMLGPLLGISAGWIFTEMGRQPWVVFGQQLTANGVSPSITATEVWISLIGFTLVYGILAVIEVKLLLKYIRLGAPETVVEDPYEEAQSNDKLYFAY
jgi:cytochrome d ubiquinol oxidase subunit I